MADKFTPLQRRKCMAAIRSKNTIPERIVRSLAHSLGLRFRLHGADLPGTPDLVFRSRRCVVFVHGCYWHMHNCKRGRSTPTTNAEFWRTKREKTRQRDKRTRSALRRLGWRAIVIWECELGANRVAKMLLRLRAIRDMKSGTKSKAKRRAVSLHRCVRLSGNGVYVLPSPEKSA